jgi:AraC-like DNA-binding protein
MDFAYQGTLYLLGVSLTFIVSFILFRSAAGNPRINRLLGVAFFCMAWYNMIYYLTVTDQIPRFYWILGWGTPLYYLITPCIFLYVRHTLNGTRNLTRKDWIHFLPFFIVLVDHLPFCLGLYGSKMEFARLSTSNHNQFYLHRVALIPSITHFVARPLQALCYLFFQWKLIIQAYPQRKRKGKVYRWVILLTTMVTTFYLTLSVLTFSGILGGSGMYVVLNYKGLILLLDICLLFVSMGLLFYPEALYGIPNFKEIVNAPQEQSTPKVIPANPLHIDQNLPEPWGPLVFPTTVHSQVVLADAGSVNLADADSVNLTDADSVGLADASIDAAKDAPKEVEATKDLPKEVGEAKNPTKEVDEVKSETSTDESSYPQITPFLIPKSTRENRMPKGEDIQELIQIIERHLREDKPYLLPKWSIQEMAVATHIPLHQLSFVINHHYKVRYTELMNRYRVSHAKELIAAGAWKELSLEGLAKQSGFANRTNFFLVFKKFTGLSPSEYLQSVKATNEIG